MPCTGRCRRRFAPHHRLRRGSTHTHGTCEGGREREEREIVRTTATAHTRARCASSPRPARPGSRIQKVKPETDTCPRAAQTRILKALTLTSSKLPDQRQDASGL